MEEHSMNSYRAIMNLFLCVISYLIMAYTSSRPSDETGNNSSK